jgi:hypothetical protein
VCFWLMSSCSKWWMSPPRSTGHDSITNLCSADNERPSDVKNTSKSYFWTLRS